MEEVAEVVEDVVVVEEEEEEEEEGQGQEEEEGQDIVGECFRNTMIVTCLQILQFKAGRKRSNCIS